MRRLTTTVLLAVCTALVPFTAAAQQPAAAPEPLRIEPMNSGFVIAPEAQFTEINGEFATLAGVHGGWVTDDTLFIGGAGYWLANRERDFKMQYFGGLGRWTIGGHRRLAVSAGALVGVGDATLSRPYGDLFGDRPASPSLRNVRGDGRTHSGSAITSATPVLVSDDFFITEPQVSALWRITGWMRLDAGVSYRLIGGADLLNDQLRGASGRIALQLGR